MKEEPDTDAQDVLQKVTSRRSSISLPKKPDSKEQKDELVISNHILKTVSTKNCCYL